jgi:pilus assembly protein Flp/PilA
MFLKAIVALQTFRKEEDGLALTEYLVLLGLLVGGVIAAVTAFGGGLSTAWGEWTTWITEVVGDTSPTPAAPPPAPTPGT